MELDRNVGLGPALDVGLAACRHDVVARMDADDISLPHRFAVQMPIIEAGADIVGSGLLEFGEGADDVVGRRIPPTDPDDIRARARFADPFNHPTVVYRRDVRAGRRRLHRLRADGGLPALGEDDRSPGRRWRTSRSRWCATGSAPGRTRRRGGLAQLRAELAVQRRFRRLGFTTTAQYVRNVVVRGGYRLVPEGVRRVAYRRLVAPYGDRRGAAARH